MRSIGLKGAIRMLVGAVGLGLMSSPAVAQGCEPIRFTTPIDLGGQGQVYQPGREWRFTLAYRRLYSNEFFVGSSENQAMAPGGESPVFNINTFVADVSYSLTDRIRVGLSLPFSTGTLSRKWDDSLHHEQSASGIGDLGATGEFWLLNPRTHQNGNIAVGLGLKAPTGSHTKASQFYTAGGAVDFPADQTIQPGDGGWAITFQAQAHQRVKEGIYLYGSGSYMASPRAQTEVVLGPTGPPSAVHWSVPDVYQARLGAAVSVWPDQGLTVSFGGSLSGIPRRDLFGGGDSTTVKRTSQIVYADPGLSLNRGKSTFTLSIPIRIHVNRFKSLLEARSTGRLGINGGGFANYLVFASYSYRF